MGLFDFIRNEPVNEANTTEEIKKLNAAAQKAELAGDRLLADAVHHELNRELDILRDLKTPEE
ncbi:hypothetical protein ACSCBZ_46510 [Streptomyces niveiscabiei]|uniref:hypothetical protein n=1 Tax=Streptomyces niveiscabiei TaxID=164115 RepID=UPI0006EB47CF|nr:hypothetical protein [Streptomyces niveiscabiei]